MHGRLFKLIVATLASLSIIAAVTPKATPLDGVWNYLPPLRGQASYQGGRYTAFSTRLDSAPTPGPLSEAAQAKLYRTLMLQSGTFSIADTIVTMRLEHGKHPSQRPTTWRWSYFLKGDTLTWHVLDSLGRVMYSG